MYTSNITKSRIKARWFYLNKDYRDHLRAGPTRVHFPGCSGTPFDANVSGGNGIDNIAIHCPPLFRTNEQPLPLQNGDVLLFGIHEGEVFIYDIFRKETGLLTAKPPVGFAASPDDEEPEESSEDAGSRNLPTLPQQRLPGRTQPWDGNLPEGIINDCLSLRRFPPIPDYLTLNRHRILAQGEQALPPWNPVYDAISEPVMERLRYAFPTRSISRAEVVALFESWHDPVLCLVSTMVWGGIRLNHLLDLLKMGESALRARMEALRPLVRSGALETAFNDCSTGGRLKFYGVGRTFFTKLFYFIGQVPPTLKPAPLILDKWTSNAFLALGHQVCPSPTWLKWFDTHPLLGGNPATWRQPYPDAEIYRLYVAWFNHWSQLLGASASQLEQFVFGWDRRGGGNQWWNPRNQLIELGRSQFYPSSGI